MSDVAILDIRVTSSEVAEAVANLKDLTTASEQAEKSTGGLEEAADAAGKATDGFSESVTEASDAVTDLAANTDKVASEASNAIRAFDGLSYTVGDTATTAFYAYVSSTDSASSSTSSLGQAVESANEELHKTEETGARAESAVAELTVAVEEANTALKTTETAGSTAEAAVESFSEAAKEGSSVSDKLTREVASVAIGLEDAGKSAKNASSSVDVLVATFRRLILPLATAYAGIGAFRKLVDTQREFDKLQTALTTVTGSAENAAIAFQALDDYAYKTPYDLDQVSNAFIKLVNYGLDPSERALTSYGNTASSMGKSLEDMVNTVAAATAGNFQSLRTWGIRAAHEGDKVSFTFRGVTTTVKNSSKEIEGYLMSLGETQFAGAMERSLGKLDDTILALSATYDALLLNISQAGIGEALKNGVQLAVDALKELNDMVASGELPGYLKAIAGQFDLFVQDASAAIRYLRDVIVTDGVGAVSFLKEAFQDLPINVRTAVAAASVYLAAWWDEMRANREAGTEFDENFNRRDRTKLHEEKRRIAEARDAELQRIATEHIAQKRAFEEQIEASRKLREEYDRQRAAREAIGEDRLAKYQQTGDGKTGDRITEAERKAQQKAFEQLVDSLRTEEETIRESYTRRKAIIEANTAVESDARKDLMARLNTDRDKQLEALEVSRAKELTGLRNSLMTQEESLKDSYEKRIKIVQDNTDAGSELQTQLTDRLNAEYAKQLKALENAQQAERDKLLDGLLTEEEMIAKSYERRRQLIIESTLLTEEERQNLLADLQKKHAEQEQDRETQRYHMMLDNSEQLFAGMAGLAKQWGKENNATYKALFAASKAFSVASASLSIATGLAKAQELPFPANIAEYARVGALGVQIISTISGANYSGAYDEGGRIPAGKIGLVGEYGPELVKGPANITSREDTRKLMEKAASKDGSGGRSSTNLRIVNAIDPNLIGSYLGSDAGEEIVLNIIRQNHQTVRTYVGGS